MQTLRGYELREKLGAGGFGVVWRAWQPVIEREVAVKVILPQYANHPAFVRRFEAEAQLVARLEHLHIVPLYDYWRDPEGAYLVFRWLRGGSLRETLKRGPLPLATTLRLLEQVGGALVAAHRQGVIHRDVKPENILLDEEGNAYLTDFGIAQVLASLQAETASAKNAEAKDAEAEEGDVVSGSLAYISPEVARSQTPSAASDLYSLGVVAFEALTGSHPFPNLSPTTQLVKHLTEPLPALRQYNPELPEALETIIQRATAKDPAARYTSPLEFAQTLRDALPGALPLTPVDGAIAREIFNPYKGLRAFEAADAQDFFGRAALVQALVAALASSGPYARFLAVVGPSGSGKSSVVKAGLLPALQQGALPGAAEWFRAELTPGLHPVAELAQSLLQVAIAPLPDLANQLQATEAALAQALEVLLPPQNELLLVIDQFEEVFTLAADKAEAAHFLQLLFFALTQPASRLRVVVTLRADFYDRPLLHPDFSLLMRERTMVVTPLTPTELAQAIQEPAERVGVFFENTLVTTLVSEVHEQPGALPLLQYALTELFEQRQGVLLTRAAYQAIGGVLGALARRAEVAYLALSAPDQALARQLFLRLVTLGEGVEDTRRRVWQTELEALGAMDNVLRDFGQARLLAFDRDPQTRTPTVEVAHEALIREWERLREWLAESRSEVRLQRQLAHAATEWLAAREDASFLLSGARLAQFASWAEPAAPAQVALTPLEQKFLQASLAESARQAQAEAERQTREIAAARKLAETERARADEQTQAARHLRRRAWLLGLSAIGAVLLMMLVVVNGTQALANQMRAEQNAATATHAQGQAQEQAQAAQTSAAQAATAAHNADQLALVAQTERDTAKSLALASAAQAALTAGDTTQAIALAVAANHLPNPPTFAQRMLYEASHAPGTIQQLIYREPGWRATVMQYTPDEQGAIAIYTSDAEPADRLGRWDLTTGQLQYTWPISNVMDFAYLPGGQQALFAFFSPFSEPALPTQIMDLATGQTTLVLRDLTPTRWGKVLVSANGQTAFTWGQAAGTGTNVLVQWDLATGEQVRSFAPPIGLFKHIALSPDEAVLRVALANETLQQITWLEWEVATGELLTQTTSARAVEPILHAAFSPDGRWLATGGKGGQLLVWEVTTGALVKQLADAQINDILRLVWHPNSRWLLATSRDTLINLWDIDTGEKHFVFRGHGQAVRYLAFSPSGQDFLAHVGDNVLRRWAVNPAEQTPIRTLPNDSYLLAFSPNWETGLVGQYRPAQLNVVSETNPGHYHIQETWPVESIHWGSLSTNAAGRLALVNQNELWLWPTAATTPTYKIAAHPEAIWHSEISPDGQQFVVMYFDDETGQSWLRVFTTATGQPERDLKLAGFVAPTSLAFSSDSRYLLLAYTNDVDKRNWVGVWDWQADTWVRAWESDAGPLVFARWREADREVVGVGQDGSLQIWAVATGEKLQHLVGPFPVRYAALSPAGNLAALVSQVGEVAVVALANGDILRRTQFAETVVPSPIFAPDGDALLLAPFQQHPLRWELRLNLPDLLAWTYANRYVRDLTCSERAFFGLPACDAAGTPPPTQAPVFASPTSSPTQPTLRGTPTALPTWTPSPGPTPTASPTLTPQPTPNVTGTAQLGDNLGFALDTEAQGWLYTAQAGTGLRLSVTPNDPEFWPVVEVWDASGQVILHDTTPDTPAYLVFPTDGEYIIAVRGFAYVKGGPYTLNLTVWEPEASPD